MYQIFCKIFASPSLSLSLYQDDIAIEKADPELLTRPDQIFLIFPIPRPSSRIRLLADVWFLLAVWKINEVSKW